MAETRCADCGKIIERKSTGHLSRWASRNGLNEQQEGQQ